MMKFEFTSETRIEGGVTLYRIRAVISFGFVLVGEIGGWLESESNLSQTGDARVSGYARVSGDARTSPIVLSGLAWAVTITETHMQIGCEFHSHAEWETFAGADWIRMGGKEAALMLLHDYPALRILCRGQATPKQEPA